LQKGHRIVELKSWSDSKQEAANWSKQFGQNWSHHENVARRDGSVPVRGQGASRAQTDQQGEGGSSAHGSTHGAHEQLVPVLENFEELVMRSYFSFDEMMNVWARDVRNRRTGECFLRLVDNPGICDVKVKRSVPGHLAWDWATLHRELPEVVEDMQRFIEENFRSDVFVSPAVIDRETQERLDAVLHPAITLSSTSPQPASVRAAHAPITDDGPLA
jgi:hypothetical protein